MNLKDIVLLVWDDPINFNLPETKRQFGDGKLYGDVKSFQTKEEFDTLLKGLDQNTMVVICCHVKYEDFSGVLDFRNSGLKEHYHIPEVIYLSSGDSGDIMQKLYEKYKISLKIILYNELIRELKLEETKPLKISQLHLKESNITVETTKPIENGYPQIDYAVITALFEDEFEEVARIVDFSADEIIRTKTKEFHIGYLKTDRTKKLVVAIPSATGMVDSAIIATQMLEFFKPRYLIMSGVCGGRPELNFGDIVIAKTVFIFQKGKISDVNTKYENGKLIPLELFDKGGTPVDYEHLYDKEGNQISLSIEKFEAEHDTIIEIDSLLKDGIERTKGRIGEAINKDISPFGKVIKIVIEPMGCSTMVINKDGFFDDRIKIIDRKTAAVEMESYGVARASKFGNNGDTKFIIFKSVMDNMTQKDDKAKKLAAHTSAQFLKYLFEFKVI